MKLSLIALAALLCSCTATQANTGVKIATIGCEVVLSATDPALAPLCASIAEVEQAIKDIEAAAPSTSIKVTPTRDAVYQQVLRNRGKK